jgi:hypothetical protein
MKSMMSEADASDAPKKSGCTGLPVCSKGVAKMIGHRKEIARILAVTTPVTRKAWLRRKRAIPVAS